MSCCIVKVMCLFSFCSVLSYGIVGKPGCGILYDCI